MIELSADERRVKALMLIIRDVVRQARRDAMDDAPTDASVVDEAVKAILGLEAVKGATKATGQ